MCGIIGCVSDKDCYGALYDGLKRLEYRGYDSAGIAVLGEKLSVFKKKGGVSNLSAFYARGGTGIGHTRWATHGAPSDANAHPHRAGKIALVHNGIVENYAALKAELEGEGERFSSETDSEVIAKLISRAYRKDLLSAVREGLSRAEGAYAVAVVAEDRPGELVAAKNKSPLVAGKGASGLFVCSDIPALAGTADFIARAEDGDFIRIADGRIDFFDKNLDPVCRDFTRPREELRALSVAGGGYFMRAEIGEIPRALEDTLSALKNADFAPCARALRSAERIFAVACGTAFHSALVFADVAEREAGVPVLCCTAGEFRYRPPVIGEGDVLVAVSQSGETADTLEAVRLAKARGAFVIAVTNVEQSTLARLADLPLRTLAGAEVAVAATKSYNCQLLALFYLAAQTVFYKRACFPSWFAALGAAADACAGALEGAADAETLAARLQSARALYFIGRGTDRFTAAEGALKVREIAYVFAESCPAGELKHGTLALVEEGFPVIAVATGRALLQKNGELPCRGEGARRVHRAFFAVRGRRGRGGCGLPAARPARAAHAARVRDPAAIFRLPHVPSARL